jgi:hypothetical protein
MLNIDDGVVRNRQGSFRKGAVERSEKDWARIRSAILNALELYPGAREAVVQALVELRAMDEGEAR